MIRLWSSIDIRWRLLASAVMAVIVLPLAWYLGSPLQAIQRYVVVMAYVLSLFGEVAAILWWRCNESVDGETQ